MTTEMPIFTLRSPLRSLTIKLTLAFLLVGVTGALLVALIVGYRTSSEFDRFISERDQTVLVDALRSSYMRYGSWDGVADLLASDRRLGFYSRNATLADSNGVVVLSDRGDLPGSTLDRQTQEAAIPIVVDGQTVGVVSFVSSSFMQANFSWPQGPEREFLERVSKATILSAGIAVLIALVLGGMLARTLTRSVRDLTMATRAMALGKLDQKVLVRSRDEIGDLAASFNQMSADLANASRLRRQMTADLAHDLRTPLSILRGYTEGLKDTRLKGTPAVFAIMYEEVEHLQRLVEDLRILSLADAGELPLNQRAVDPKALLERTGLAHFVQAEQQGLTLQVDADDTLPSVLVDTDRMNQVLNNLVSNALRHTAHGGVVLAAGVVDSQVLLQVRDTGSGIASEDLPFVFERFYRTDKARQRSDGTSSGLGLAIARAIVEAHNGTISVDSREGEGTTFTVALPQVVDS